MLPAEEIRTNLAAVNGGVDSYPQSVIDFFLCSTGCPNGIVRRSLIGPDCVKTHRHFDFWGLPTITQLKIFDNSAFWQADFFQADSILRFYTASAMTGRSLLHLNFTQFRYKSAV
jgi:hypothetical protein